MKCNTKAKQHFVYRVDHDTGFAPHIEDGVCSLCGCKYKKSQRNIEELADKGSWIIGIGGNNTTKPNKLIYMMKVDDKLKVEDFKERSYGKYLSSQPHGEYALISREFYYFGNNAIDIPDELNDIIIKTHGFKYIHEYCVKKLIEHIESLGYSYGKHGEPNNAKDYPICDPGEQRDCHSSQC